MHLLASTHLREFLVDRNPVHIKKERHNRTYEYPYGTILHRDIDLTTDVNNKHELLPILALVHNNEKRLMSSFMGLLQPKNTRGYEKVDDDTG